ncbi:MAG: redox-regulated ATPase YchF, partial [Clostridia bacterium]|nr:redox-regulated ATPase YchF [Clostridia bacterium]
REVDAIVHVVRCFDDSDIIHVEGSVDPVRDVETINMELIFSDVEMLERRADRVRKAMKGDKTLAGELDLCERVIKFLEEGKCARGFNFTDEELELISQSPLLTLKPVIYAANVSEDDIADPSGCVYYNRLKELADSEKSGIISVCAAMEAEFAELEPEERDEFLADAGLSESGLVRLINESYSLLGLISFLTAGPKEVRAWTITKGMTAPKAAGKIHSDFERGFIRAEIVSFDDLVRLGSVNAAREAGLYRSEGKEYVMKDGDVVLFRFNV